MAGPNLGGTGLTRRGVIRRSLQAGAYAAPVVLSAVAVRPVGAQVTRPTATPVPTATSVPTATMVPMVLCMQPVTFEQDLLLFNAAPGATYDIFSTTNMGAPATATRLGSITTDAAGVGGAVFPLALNTSTTTSVTLFVSVAGQPPTNAAATRVSTLVTALACAAGGPRATASLIGFIVQETTGMGQLNDFVDAGLFNVTPNTAYDLFIQPNGTGTPIRVTTVTTNAAGNSTTITPVMVSGPAATSVQLIAVLAGASPNTPLFTTTVSGTQLVTVPAIALAVAPSTTRVPEARTLR